MKAKRTDNASLLRKIGSIFPDTFTYFCSPSLDYKIALCESQFPTSVLILTTCERNVSLKPMSNETDTQVNSLHRPRGNAKTRQRSQRDNKANRKQRHDKLCNRCGSEPHTSDKKCPTSGAGCHYCHKRGHFSKICQKRNQVHGIQNQYGIQNSDLKNDDVPRIN